MPGLSPLQPDHDYCVHCHAPAAGRCGRCHVLLCADCSVLVPGLSRPLALCKQCAAQNEKPGRRLLVWLVVPLAILALLALLSLLLRS